MPRIFPPLVSVDRAAFKVTIWKMKLTVQNYVRAHTFDCALGAVGHTTPAGVYYVSGRSRKPAWKPPDSDWVGHDLRDPETGETLVFAFDDPRNPFAGGFMALGGNEAGQGVGFHGTKFDPQVGTRASHGCIRLKVEDLDVLFRKVPDGTLVFIHGESRGQVLQNANQAVIDAT